MAHNEDIKYVKDSRIPAKRKVNVPKPYSEYPGKTEPFFPNFLLKEWMVAVVTLIGFLILVISHPSPLEKLADPTDSSYIPLPDWYFLFLYQLLKYFPGNLEVVGTVIIPGLFFGMFLLAPWLDRGPERRPSKRPISTGIMLFTIAAIVFMTWQAVDQHEKQVEAEGKGVESQEPAGDQGAAGGDATAVDFDAAAAYTQSCAGCHGVELEGAYGPSLVGLTYSPEEIVDIINNGKKGEKEMPPGTFQGSDEEKQALAEWILEHQ